MSKALWDYGRMLGLVSACCAVYVLAISPWITPTKNLEEDRALNFVSDNVGYWWDEIFPEGSWQRKKPKVLETGQAILLFENWERAGSNKWKLKPLTILIPPDSGRSISSASLGAKTKRPILIEASDGAVIQFKGAIDITSGTTPPLETSQLLGKIRIHSPASKPGANDDLEILTEQVRIDRRKIWTSQPVDLRFGESIAKGRDLSIFLDKNLLSSGTPDDSAWEGLDRLELIYVDEVRLALPAGGLFANWKKPQESSASESLAPAPSLAPAWLGILCDGPFRFDFRRSVAELQDRVRITHQVDGQAPDTFNADSVRLFVERADVGDANAKPASNKTTSTMKLGPLLVKRLEADGKGTATQEQPESLVQLEAPSVNSAGRGRSLTLDLVERRISWANRLATEPPSSDPIYMRHEQIEFWTPVVHYRMSPDPKRLGWLSAAGPGHAIARTETQGNWQIDWTKSLQMIPENEDERLTIDGDAVVTGEHRGRFSAATIDLWIRSNENFTPGGNASGKTAVSNWQWQPDRMEAIGKVSIQSPQLNGDFAQLALWFTYQKPVVAAPATEAVASGNESPSSLQLNPATGPSLPVWVNQPESNRPKNKPVSDGPALQVSGHRLHGRLLWTPEAMLVDDMTIQGGVTLTRESIDPSNPMPLVINGDQLRMNTSDGGMADVAISGQPAKVNVGQGWLQGPVVRLNQRDQLVWIDQPGSFGVPPESLQRNRPGQLASSQTMTLPLGSSSANQKLQWLDPPSCNWNGKMLFDGRTARMDGGVRISGRLMTDPVTVWHFDGTAEQLEIQLTKNLSERSTQGSAFQPIPGGDKVDINRIILSQNVDLRAVQTDPQGVRKSMEHLVVPRLVVDVPTQHLVGEGPGWIRSRRPSKTPLQNGPGQFASQRASNLSCMHLTFTNQLDGYLERMEFIFGNQVEVGVGPIRTWDESIDVTNLTQLAPGQMLLSCQALRVYDAGQLPSVEGSSWDLEAQNQVVFEGRTDQGNFSGSADRIGYEASKDLLRVFGDPRKPAVIQRMADGKPPVRLDVTDAAIRTKTLEIEEMHFSQLNIDLPGANTAQPAPDFNGNAPTNPLPGNTPRPSPRDSLFQRRGPGQ